MIDKNSFSHHGVRWWLETLHLQSFSLTCSQRNISHEAQEGRVRWHSRAIKVRLADSKCICDQKPPTSQEVAWRTWESALKQRKQCSKMLVRKGDRVHNQLGSFSAQLLAKWIATTGHHKHALPQWLFIACMVHWKTFQQEYVSSNS